MNLESCNLCPLHENLLAGCSPLKTYGKGNILLVESKPSQDEIMIGRPCSMEYDFLKKNLNFEFQYTYVNKCSGIPSTSDMKTCIKNWLVPELSKYKTVFCLGIIPARHILKLKTKIKISDILGHEFTIDNTTIIPNYSTNKVLSSNKTVLDKFLKVFYETVSTSTP